MTLEDSAVIETRTVQVGNYRFTGKVLGKGTFATVEEAVHIHLRVKVSVKSIDLTKCNAYVLKNLKREAAILNQLNHPHILRIFEALKYTNTYCLVTERVSGGDLCALLQQHRGKGLEEKTTRRYSRQIVSALQYLHDCGIVHRDLKLENIMLDSRKENIKLIDFGLSNHWSFQSPLKTLCGSPEYSAPELFVHGTQYGPEVDMWALGVVMYAMAVGQLPFPCVSTIIKVPEKKKVFIKLINNGLSQSQIARIVGYHPDFSELMKGLMNPNWERRMSVDDVMKDPWLSNKNHWMNVPHDTLDAYDLAKVMRQVCTHLNMTEGALRHELKSTPCGEIAGFYNIALYLRSRPRRIENWNRFSKTSTRLFQCSASKETSIVQNEEKNMSKNKIWVVGTAAKVNEVVNRGKRSLQNNIHASSGSIPYKSHRTTSSYKTDGSPDRMTVGDCFLPVAPQIGPFRAKKAESISSDTPKSRESDKESQTCVRSRFKEKHSLLRQPILPSKLKLKSPPCKLGLEQSFRLVR